LKRPIGRMPDLCAAADSGDLCKELQTIADMRIRCAADPALTHDDFDEAALLPLLKRYKRCHEPRLR
jgi:hypothetical protein